MARRITENRVFIASPGGLEDIRKIFREVLLEYSEDEGVHHRVRFEPVGWEYTLPGRGRPQGLINRELGTCDFFVLVLGTRWGSPPSRDGSSVYSSGCEEEFYFAERCLGEEYSPMRQIIVLFRAVPPEMLADPGPQLLKVLEFKQRLEDEKRYLYDTFDEGPGFKRILRRLLAQWVRDHSHVTSLPSPIATQFRDEKTPEINKAETLAGNGKLIEAEDLFVRAVVRGNDFYALDSYGQFLRRAGRLAQAEVMFERILEMAGDEFRAWKAEAISGLSCIEMDRGNLEEAEEGMKRALEVFRTTDDNAGTAAALCSLGAVYIHEKRLGLAKEALNEGLRFAHEADNLHIVARLKINLGLISLMRGKLKDARVQYQEVLQISRDGGSPEGIAKAHEGLARVSHKLGEQSEAKEHSRAASDYFQKLGISTSTSEVHRESAKRSTEAVDPPLHVEDIDAVAGTKPAGRLDFDS